MAPHLAMAVESARLAKKGDRRAAIAYHMLGADTGQVMTQPEQLNSASVKQLADRAEALAGAKGDPARQAEINAAQERFKQMTQNAKPSLDSLADRLESLALTADASADNASKRPGLMQDLKETDAEIPAPGSDPMADESLETAKQAVDQSIQGIEGAPKAWESYKEAAQTLSESARQIRMNEAIGQSKMASEQMQKSQPQPSKESQMPSDMPGPSDQNAGNAAPGAAPKGMDQVDWARLNGRLRDAIRSSGIEHFSEEQQKAIRAYFQKLSNEK
jgi:hypothetical protein